MTESIRIADRLRELMDRAHLSGREIERRSKIVDDHGLTEGWVRFALRGGNVTLTKIKTLAAVFRLPAEVVLGNAPIPLDYDVHSVAISPESESGDDVDFRDELARLADLRRAREQQLAALRALEEMIEKAEDRMRSRSKSAPASDRHTAKRRDNSA